MTSYRLFGELYTTSWFLLYCRFLHALLVELLDRASVNKLIAVTCHAYFLLDVN